METRKYPLTDELKELTADSLDELALRLEIEVSAFQQMNTHEGQLLANDRMERAIALREAADYYLHL